MTSRRKYDVFISYAIEEKENIALPLKQLLEKNGITVFFAGDELRPGDDVGKTIFAGLHRSRYAIVILSPAYNRKWTLGELFFFLNKQERRRRDILLPVWHNIDFEEVKQRYELLSGKFAYHTTKGIDRMADDLTAKIREWIRRDRWQEFRRVACIAAFVFVSIVSTWLFTGHSPAKASGKENVPQKEPPLSKSPVITCNFFLQRDKDKEDLFVLSDDRGTIHGAFSIKKENAQTFLQIDKFVHVWLHYDTAITVVPAKKTP